MFKYLLLTPFFFNFGHSASPDFTVSLNDKKMYGAFILTALLTHWGRDQIDAISQTTLSNALSRIKMNEFHLGFHWSLFLRFELTIPALVQIMAWRRPGDKPLSEPMMVSLLTHICVTRPQWVKYQVVIDGTFVAVILLITCWLWLESYIDQYFYSGWASFQSNTVLIVHCRNLWPFVEQDKSHTSKYNVRFT